jgi:hypothetical protein
MTFGKGHQPARTAPRRQIRRWSVVTPIAAVVFAILAEAAAAAPDGAVGGSGRDSGTLAAVAIAAGALMLIGLVGWACAVTPRVRDRLPRPRVTGQMAAASSSLQAAVTSVTAAGTSGFRAANHLGARLARGAGWLQTELNGNGSRAAASSARVGRSLIATAADLSLRSYASARARLDPQPPKSIASEDRPSTKGENRAQGDEVLAGNSDFSSRSHGPVPERVRPKAAPPPDTSPEAPGGAAANAANKAPAVSAGSQPQAYGSPREAADAAAAPIVDPDQRQSSARESVGSDAPPGEAPPSEAGDGGDPLEASTVKKQAAPRPRDRSSARSPRTSRPAVSGGSQPQAYGSPREAADAAAAPIANPDPLESLVDLVEDFGDELLRPPEAPPSVAGDGGDPVEASTAKKQAAPRPRKRSSARAPRKRRKRSSARAPRKRRT